MRNDGGRATFGDLKPGDWFTMSCGMVCCKTGHDTMDVHEDEFGGYRKSWLPESAWVWPFEWEWCDPARTTTP